MAGRSLTDIPTHELLALRIRSDEAVLNAFPKAGLVLVNGGDGREVFDLCEKKWLSVCKILGETNESVKVAENKKSQRS